MNKTKIVLIGFGYRANYFYRITKYIEEFEIVAIVVRNEDKAKIINADTNIYTTTNLDEALAIEHDYSILAVTKENAKSMLEVLMSKNEKVLCETPPANSITELEELYDLYKKYNGKIQVSEQYPFWSIYTSYFEIIEQRIIGDPTFLRLSKVHGYHGACILRRLLNIKYNDFTITGKAFDLEVTRTSERSGLYYDGKTKNIKREVLNIEFDNGKVCLWDFTSELYFSHFLSQNVEITGNRGQILNETVKYLNKDNVPVTSALNRFDRGVYQNREWSHEAITFENKVLFRTPFDSARLNDDELAIATCMRKMKEFCDTGSQFYKFEDALHDTYMSLLMDEALSNPYTQIKSKKMKWVK